MERLLIRICKKCESGLEYREAVQLMLWAYSTLDILPEEFQQLKLSRQELCGVFTRLSAAGKIKSGPGDANGTQETPLQNIARYEHWDDLIARLLRQEIVLDETFPGRIRHYV